MGGGGNAGLIGLPMDYLLKEYKVPAAQLQVYKSAVLIPWPLGHQNAQILYLPACLVSGMAKLGGGGGVQF